MTEPTSSAKPVDRSPRVERLVPSAMFFTNGAGVHKDELTSFELALRDAGVEKANLVTVSSIFPPRCRELGRHEGVLTISPGQIVYCVMARRATNEPNRLVAAAIGLARPSSPEMFGYLSEHHAFGETGKKAGEYAEELAATMLATRLGLPFEAASAWSATEAAFKTGETTIKTRHVVQSAVGNAHGLWTTVVALAVFVLDPIDARADGSARA